MPWLTRERCDICTVTRTTITQFYHIATPTIVIYFPKLGHAQVWGRKWLPSEANPNSQTKVFAHHQGAENL